MIVWLKDIGRKNSGKKKQVSTERSRSDSDPHRSFDSPFLMSPSFLRGPQIVRYRLCNSQWRVIDGNWKRRRAANGKGNFLPGQVNFKDTSRSVTPTTRDSTSRWLLLLYPPGGNGQSETRRELIKLISRYIFIIRSPLLLRSYRRNGDRSKSKNRTGKIAIQISFIRLYPGGRMKPIDPISALFISARVNRSRLKQYLRVTETFACHRAGAVCGSVDYPYFILFIYHGRRYSSGRSAWLRSTRSRLSFRLPIRV